MQPQPKLNKLITAIKANKAFWQGKIQNYWKMGHQAGLGFAMGDHDDKLAKALAKEGYYLIAEIDGMAIGTNGITSIVAVTNQYGPWAVDITDMFFQKSIKQLPQISQTNEKQRVKHS